MIYCANFRDELTHDLFSRLIQKENFSFLPISKDLCHEYEVCSSAHVMNEAINLVVNMYNLR